MNTINKEREDLEALLPWHAVGTLSRRDSERVEKALASDHELARRFDLVREELNETIHLNETLGAPSARAMEKLFAAIDAEPARKPKVSFNLTARIAGFISSFSPRTLAWSATAAAVAIVLQAGVITTALIQEQSRPSTELASTDLTDGTRAVIRFTPQATAADITKFLDANKAEVIDGPKRGGLYTLHLSVTGPAKDELIKRMQTQTALVEFIATVQ
jgi:anti-sigma-K factor RskA